MSCGASVLESAPGCWALRTREPQIPLLQAPTHAFSALPTSMRSLSPTLCQVMDWGLEIQQEQKIVVTSREPV